MVKKALTYDDVFLKCASLCAKSEHSAVELIGKMCRWGVSIPGSHEADGDGRKSGTI